MRYVVAIPNNDMNEATSVGLKLEAANGIKSR